jgi:hypothetical protein
MIFPMMFPIIRPNISGHVPDHVPDPNLQRIPCLQQCRAIGDHFVDQPAQKGHALLQCPGRLLSQSLTKAEDLSKQGQMPEMNVDRLPSQVNMCLCIRGLYIAVPHAQLPLLLAPFNCHQQPLPTTLDQVLDADQRPGDH